MVVLVTGGAFQGKCAFAEERLDEWGVPAGEWCDGETARWEEFCRAPRCRNLPAMVRRRMEELGAEFSGVRFAGELLSGPKDRVIVTCEVGCGIVPLDRSDRDWREETGRAACRIAAGAGEVWRVIGGIGQKIK